MKKAICTNCQYFCRHYRDNAGTEYTFEVTPEQRVQALQGDFSWQKDIESLACHKGIWDEGCGFPQHGKAGCISKQNRRNLCYFFEFQPGMLLPAAEKLQQDRSLHSRELQKYRLAVYALLLTIIGLIIKMIHDQT